MELPGEFKAAIALDGHVDDIGVAEQVVQVTQGLLVGAHQEYTQVIVFPGYQAVQVQRVALALRGREAIDLAIAIAGEVRQYRRARRVSPTSRWIGIIGNSWSIAQISGSDWNRLKLP